MTRRHGVICYTAPAEILRDQARSIYSLRHAASDFGDYRYLAAVDRFKWWGADGEVQVFYDFRKRVSVARQVRNEILGHPRQPIPDEETRWQIQGATDRRR
jgi:hypothetical protein